MCWQEALVANQTDARVLMVGPDLSLRGGIVSVVDGYLEAGLPDKCGAFTFHGTGVGTSLLTKSLAFAKSFAAYRRIVGDYDIVHLHISARGSYKRKAMMARIAKKAGKKVVLHEHSGEFARDFEAGGDAYRADVRRTFNGADCVVVLSQEWHDYFAKNVMEDAAKLVVLHNGVKIPPMACDPCSRQDVLFLGRLDVNKSPDVLLRASRAVLAAEPAMHLVFGGDGVLDRYKAVAGELGIADRCEFLGWVAGDDKERLFERAGIYCLPSKNEAMPISVMEAMAHGLPVIATRVGGVPQLIEDGVDGLLMDVDDVEGLSGLLLGLASSPERRAELGFAGRKKIVDKFSVQASVEGLLDVYEDLMREARA
jgi:polysaccharide biosynthesis protein VpsI